MPAGTSIITKGLSVTFRPRALIAAMASMTLRSDGVPPKAAPPSCVEISIAEPRLSPETLHAFDRPEPFAVVTAGRMRQ